MLENHQFPKFVKFAPCRMGSIFRQVPLNLNLPELTCKKINTGFHSTGIRFLKWVATGLKNYHLIRVLVSAGGWGPNVLVWIILYIILLAFPTFLSIMSRLGCRFWIFWQPAPPLQIMKMLKQIRQIVCKQVGSFGVVTAQGNLEWRLQCIIIIKLEDNPFEIF